MTEFFLEQLIEIIKKDKEAESKRFLQETKKVFSYNNLSKFQNKDNYINLKYVIENFNYFKNISTKILCLKFLQKYIFANHQAEFIKEIANIVFSELQNKNGLIRQSAFYTAMDFVFIFHNYSQKKLDKKYILKYSWFFEELQKIVKKHELLEKDLKENGKFKEYIILNKMKPSVLKSLYLFVHNMKISDEDVEILKENNLFIETPVYEYFDYDRDYDEEENRIDIEQENSKIFNSLNEKEIQKIKDDYKVISSICFSALENLMEILSLDNKYLVIFKINLEVDKISFEENVELFISNILKEVDDNLKIIAEKHFRRIFDWYKPNLRIKLRNEVTSIQMIYLWVNFKKSTPKNKLTFIEYLEKVKVAKEKCFEIVGELAKEKNIFYDDFVKNLEDRSGDHFEDMHNFIEERKTKEFYDLENSVFVVAQVIDLILEYDPLLISRIESSKLSVLAFIFVFFNSMRLEKSSCIDLSSEVLLKFGGWKTKGSMSSAGRNMFNNISFFLRENSELFDSLISFISDLEEIEGD